MLRITNYRKAYGSFLVLDIPFLELEAKNYWLQGENGVGKTTLIKSVAGLIPFDGDIAIDNNSIRRHRMNYLKQVNYAEAEPVYPSFLTGNDLIRFYAKCKGGTNTKQLIDLFKIGDYVSNKIGSYSSGMVKKLSLVLAFIGQPTLILLDEPLITLDSEAQEALYRVVEKMSGAGVAFIISSHHALQMLHERISIHNKSLQLLTA